MQEVARLTQQGDLLLSNSINERLPKIHDTFSVQLRSTGGFKCDYLNRYMKINNKDICIPDRGINLIRLDQWGELVDSSIYDTHHNNDNANLLADKITNSPDGYTLIFSTWDQPSNSLSSPYLTGELKNALETLGFELLNWNYRCAWLGIAKKGLQFPLAEKFAAGETVDTFCELDMILDKGVIHFPFDNTTTSIQGIKPSINTNTTLTSDGIAVEQSTTNLITNQDLTTWHKKNITVELTNETYMNMPVYKVEYPGSSNNRIYLNNIGTFDGNITHSIYYKRGFSDDEGGDCTLYIRESNFGTSYGGVRLNNDDKKWHKASITRNLKTPTDLMFLLYKSSSYITENVVIYFCMPQSEQKTFATSFIDGSRGDARLKLPLNSNVLNPVEGSLILKYTPQEYLFSDTGFLDIFDCVNASTNRFLILRRNATHKLISLMFIRSGGSHIPVEIGSKVKPNQENVFIWTWKNNDKYTMRVNGDLVKTGNYTTCDRSWSDIQFVQDGIVNSLSIYNKALSDNEIKVLTNQPFVIDSNTHELITDSINETEDIGWILVYEGLCTHCIKEDETDYEEVNRYGDDILFDEIKITCPYWDYSVSSKLEEVAKLKKSFKYYIEWLFNQADADSPSIMFHDINDSQHVKLINNNTLLCGYGNGWRKITPIHYVDEASNMYNGAVDQSIIKVKEWANSKFRSHWGNQIYCNNMHHQDIPESGKFGLTPREFQTIQVWVKRVNVPSEKINCTKDTVTVKGYIKEGQIL